MNYREEMKKLSELSWEEPGRDELFEELKKSIEAWGIIYPLVVDEKGRVLDGRKRAAALMELINEERVTSRYVRVIVTGDELLAVEVNCLKTPPSLEDFRRILEKRASEEKTERKVIPFPGRRRPAGAAEEEELISELLRARGIGPRIFRELVRESLLVIAPLEEEEEEDLRELLEEANEFLEKIGEFEHEKAPGEVNQK